MNILFPPSKFAPFFDNYFLGAKIRLFALCAVGVASALNAVLPCRNAEKNVICVKLHKHYPLPAILPSLGPKFVPPILEWTPRGPNLTYGG